MAFGCTTNILYLLIYYSVELSNDRIQDDEYLACASTTVDCVVNYPTAANAFMKLNSTSASSTAVERLFSASAVCTIVVTARRCRMQEKTLDTHILEIHSQALKHNVDIPDNLCCWWRETVETLETRCVELFTVTKKAKPSTCIATCMVCKPL